MKKVYILLIGLVGIHILILSNIQFTAWPEMFSFPYMIDRGFLIYKDFHHIYQPLLTYVLLFTYKVFGFHIFTLKTFTYILIALTDLMLYLNIKKITKKKLLSLFVLGLYVLLQPIFDGNMLWFDIAVTLPILVSIYLLDINLFLSGFLIAIAFLIKQQAILIGLPIFIYLLATKTKFEDIKKFLLGCLTPVMVLLLMLAKYNLFVDYIFWTFEFPIIHLPRIAGYSISPTFKELIILGTMILSLLIGAVTNYKKLNSKFYLLISILFFLILSAFPRFSLFHLQPALAVFVVTVGYLLNLNKKYFVLLFLPVLFLWKAVILNPNKDDRFYTQSDVNMANQVKKRVGDNKVYLLGPSSIEYVLSNTIPPKPWIENYVWHFETPNMQERLIEGWKINSPEYIYWSIPQNGNWYDLGTYQPKEVVKYIIDNYKKIDQQDDVEIWKLQ